MDKLKELETRLDDLEQRISILENNKQQQPQDNIFPEFSEIIIKNIEKIPTKKLVILSLKNSPSQSIKSIEENLLNIGWVKDSFFTKNFGSALINKGLVQPEGRSSGRKKTYSLTARGNLHAKELLKKLENKFSSK